MKLNFNDLDIMSLDLKTLTPEQRSALLQWAVRRAHAERSRALVEMCALARSWLRSAASALASRAPPLNRSLHMQRHILSVAAVLAIAMASTVDQAAAGKVPSLHIYPSPALIAGFCGLDERARNASLFAQRMTTIDRTTTSTTMHRNIGEKQ